ncbi:hypothetical protein [Butyrivibrio sp. AE2032]|uniref:hypothetical protein n=1 Tax=Butyrivibrio sp. AE2032 TaxID=1458463 RepID=UPI0006913B2D|nr:hypothetical protein [Butyrivibrio sp. AE2032]
MPIRLIESMIAREKLLTDTISSLEEKLAAFPDGKITYGHHNGGVHYFLLGEDSKKKYLSQDDDELIRQLIQKEYVQKALETARKESTKLRSVIRSYPRNVIEDLYDALPEERRRYARPIVTGNIQDVKEWLEASYKRKPFNKSESAFFTIRGERVRSKSEVIIADRLWTKGIPYRYECPLLVGDEIIHPDFTILRLSDLKLVYHEHCGKMGDPKYTGPLLKRINDYSHEGIILGDRLFLTFESDENPLDLTTLDALIEKHYR